MSGSSEHEVTDIALNRVVFDDELLGPPPDAPAPTPEQLELMRRTRLFVQTVRNPAELWFHGYVNRTAGGMTYSLRYVSVFASGENESTEILVVAAEMQRPGLFRVSEVHYFPEDEFDSDVWRRGLLFTPVPGGEPAEARDNPAGVCWEESVRENLHRHDRFIARDVLGERYDFATFAWTPEQAREAAEFREKAQRHREIDSVIARCTKDPDIVVERPSVHRLSGAIIAERVYGRVHCPPGGQDAVHQFVVAEIRGERSEIIDVVENADADERAELLLGVVVHTRETEAPRYRRDGQGFVHPDTGERIDTETLISRIPHPGDPDRTLWHVIVVKSPRSEPPEIIEMHLFENEKEVEPFRRGILLHRKDSGH